MNDRLRDCLYDQIGGPLTRWDWAYVGFIVVLSIFMGAMVPVWMQIDWLMSIAHFLGSY